MTLSQSTAYCPASDCCGRPFLWRHRSAPGGPDWWRGGEHDAIGTIAAEGWVEAAVHAGGQIAFREGQ
jgi:hypothetical protein